MALPVLVRAIPSAGTTGADASTITVAFDATGCDVLVVGFSYNSAGGGNITGASISVATYAGVAMTVLKAFVANAGSATAGAGLVAILAPTTGSNNIVITMTGGAPATPRITLNASGWVNVSGFGDIQTDNPAGAATNENISVSAAVGDLGVGFGAHGSTITGVGALTTICGVVNNRTTDTAGGCGIMGSRPGAGGTTIINFSSGVSDQWTMHAVTLIGSSAFGNGPIPFLPRGIAPDWMWTQRRGDDPVASPPQTVNAQVADLVLVAVPGVATAGTATVTGQIATLTLTALAGTTTGNGVTVSAQVATLTLAALPGVETAGNATVTAQVATVTLTPIAGVVSAGSATIAAQIATLTLTAVPGSTGGSQTVTAQVATITLTPLAGVVTGGAISKTAQIATLTLTPVAGTIGSGVTITAQVATLALTAVPGTRTAGAVTVQAQVALLTLVARAGVLTTGSVTVAAQRALLTLIGIQGSFPGALPPLVPPFAAFLNGYEASTGGATRATTAVAQTVTSTVNTTASTSTRNTTPAGET